MEVIGVSYNGQKVGRLKGKATISDCLEVAEMVSFPLKTAKMIVEQVIEGIKSR